MAQEATGGIGDRVASLRGLAGMTEQQLAASAGVEVGLLRAVEHSQAPAGAALTAAVARALEVEVTALTRQPYEDLVGDPRTRGAGVPALRQALSEHDHPGPVDELLSVEELRARLDAAARLRYLARTTELCHRLPELLRSLYVHGERPPRGQRAGEVLAALLDDAYCLAQVVTYAFGYVDLTGMLGDRRGVTTAASGDPLRLAAADFARTDLELHRGDYDGCDQRLTRALDSLADQPGDTARAVAGQLHLRAAVVAARAGRPGDADAHLAEARDIIASGVPAHPYLDINCSQVNADVHAVAIPVELGDAATAVARAQAVRLPEDDDTECYRVGRCWIDIARAWLLHGDHAKALDALNKARDISPEQTRYHPWVRET
ncbi:MAG: hypothetical protein ACRDRZ_01205, partial [Pseudonocardiaceae bacterium]